MSKELRDVKPDVTWKEITSGGVIDSPGNAHLFKTEPFQRRDTHHTQ